MPKQLSWDALSASLNVNRKTLFELRHKAGAPAGHDPEEWRAFLASRADRGGKDTVADDAELPDTCEYDDLVRAGKITYALAKVREQVISERVTNDAKRVELDKLKGTLITKDDADRGAALIRDATIQKYDRSIARALSSLADQLPVELRALIVDAISAELDAE